MFDIRENLKTLPNLPGVYLHKDKLGQVIYVGKAISLKNRVRQYFQSSGNQSLKVKAMVKEIAEFEYIVCASEMEALILECNLIKKYSPKYNVLLRDDKTYPYIAVTLNEKYPRIIKTRILKRDGTRYFGPYSDVSAVNQIVDFFNDSLKLKECSYETFPKNFKPCLNYHIGRCQGICLGNVDREGYMTKIKEAIGFLGGNKDGLMTYFKEKMMAASEAMEYEEAAKFRDLMTAAAALSETQRVTLLSSRATDGDIVLGASDLEKSYAIVFSIRDGKLSGREVFSLSDQLETTLSHQLSSFVKQYYTKWVKAPKELIFDKPVEDMELMEEILSTDEHKVHLIVPQKGPKRELLNMAKQDVAQMLSQLKDKVQQKVQYEQSLKEELDIILDQCQSGQVDRSKPRYRVESYDISNIFGQDSVGAMVVFDGTYKRPKSYRKFRIKTVIGPDDYGSLYEVLIRRFKRFKEGDPSFMPMADLILMDGGIGQVNAAKKAAADAGVDVAIVGLAKDKSHRTRAIVLEDGREIPLRSNQILYKYAGMVQEEVHRFAIEYHRNLRGKSMVKSALDNIEGIGPKRKKALMDHFGSVSNIAKATYEELLEVHEMTSTSANSVYDYFKKKNLKG